MKRPVEFWIYFYLTCFVGAGLFSYLFYTWPSQWGVTRLLWVGIFAVLTAIAARFPVPIAPKIKVPVTSAPLYAALLLLEPPQAMTVAALGVGIANVLLRRQPYNVFFNMAQNALSVGVGSLVFHNVSPQTVPLNLSDPLTLVALPLSAIAMYMTTSGAVTLAGALYSGHNPFRLWLINRKQALMSESTLFVLGLVGVLLAQEEPWSVALMVIPTLIVYFLLQENSQLNQSLEAQMEEMRLSQAQLIQSTKLASLGTLAAGVAHEINNPIHVISGWAELLGTEPEKHLKSTKAREAVEAILEMSERVKKIVNELLDYSRLEESSELVDIHHTIDQALTLIGYHLELSDVTVQQAYEAAPAQVTGNPGKLKQVFINLLLNAKDAMPQGGVLTISTEARDGHVELAFSDTGPGIPRDHLDRIFEPFFTTKEVGNGTGLGLFVSQGIIREHKGFMRVESEIGKGATFIIRLPLVREEGSGLQDRIPVLSTSRLRKKGVLTPEGTEDG